MVCNRSHIFCLTGIAVTYFLLDRYRTAVEDVPKGEYIIPLGQAKVKRVGTDITLVGWGQQVAVLEKVVSPSASAMPGRVAQ